MEVPSLRPMWLYSIERIIALNKGAAGLFTPIIKPGSTKAVDAVTVEFNLTKPAATFLSTVPEIHVVNSKLVKANEKDGDWGQAWLSSNVAGSGSFKLERFDPAVGVTGLRNPEHFLGWAGKYVDRIDLRTVREQSTQVLGLIRGDFQGLDGYLPDRRARAVAEVRSGANHRTAINAALHPAPQQPACASQ